MARVDPLWRSDEISFYRFDHPVEHEDQPYEARADAFRASFVDAGAFNLEVGEGRWRVGTGDVMLSHPGMGYRASFEGTGFNDTCLSLIYLAAEDERFDRVQSWARGGRRVMPASNRLGYLRWLLQNAHAKRAPMLAEYVASEIFREPDATPADLFREQKFGWYAERVHAARERLDAAFDDAHSVSALARSVGMSAFHFTRVFTQLVGRPPHRYLTERRLTAARAMLEQGRSVTDTCFACGFNELSHFSRSFSRRFGVSPSRLGH
ncbi:helix-turn-helix domain-containing protein [Sphingoaurantiacus capsulatus]|uniref:Helix-turn-helix domain-containing protein n=1 Tax=Sphingoaurantiacus capsulatus TaxID=1771310 RepID=A0ABV7XEM2_9SPHN